MQHDKATIIRFNKTSWVQRLVIQVKLRTKKKDEWNKCVIEKIIRIQKIHDLVFE